PARRFIAAVLLFSLASSGDLFLLNRVTDLGMDRAWIPIARLCLQLVKSLLNGPGGRASDLCGRGRGLPRGWGLARAAAMGLGLAHSWAAAAVLLALYGVHYGLAEGGQRALLAEYVPSSARGGAFGVLLAVEASWSCP